MHILAPFLLTLAVSPTPNVAAALEPPEHDSGKSGGRMGSNHKPHHQDAKYFHEPGGDNEMGHYDARFFRGKVPYAQHRPALRHLIRSYLTTLRGLGVETWLAHGSLLGWWWGGRIMPWDYDLDAQVTVDTLRHLAQHLNRTTHEYSVPLDPDDDDGDDDPSSTATANTKTYLLDVNPHYADAGRGNGANVIDARWIDTSNGLFVDITGLTERGGGDAPGVWSCKNAHRYRTAELFPMRRTAFEGVPADVPYAFDAILAGEYGARSLVATEWAGHRWAPELKEWVQIPKPPSPAAEDGGSGAEGDGPGQENRKQAEGGEPGVVVVFVEETVVKGV